MKRAFTLIELMIVIAIIMVVLGLLVGGISCIGGGTVSESHRDGCVQKFGSKQASMLLGTWAQEGEMALMGFGGTQGKVGGGDGNVFTFYVPDEKKDIITALTDEVDSRFLVRLWYEQERFNWGWYHSTPYRVVKLEIREAPANGEVTYTDNVIPKSKKKAEADK